MDLFALQKSIERYIENNCERYLERFGIEEKPKITIDYFNLDRYKVPFICYVTFNDGGISYTNNSYQTDCMKTRRVPMSVFLIFRDGPQDVLYEKMMNGTSSFERMFLEFDVGSVLGVNDLELRQVSTFPIVAANQYILGAEFQFDVDADVYGADEY